MALMPSSTTAGQILVQQMLWVGGGVEDSELLKLVGYAALACMAKHHPASLNYYQPQKFVCLLPTTYILTALCPTSDLYNAFRLSSCLQHPPYWPAPLPSVRLKTGLTPQLPGMLAHCQAPKIVHRHECRPGKRQV